MRVLNFGGARALPPTQHLWFGICFSRARVFVFTAVIFWMSVYMRSVFTEERSRNFWKRYSKSPTFTKMVKGELLPRGKNDGTNVCVLKLFEYIYSPHVMILAEVENIRNRSEWKYYAETKSRMNMNIVIWMREREGVGVNEVSYENQFLKANRNFGFRRCEI